MKSKLNRVIILLAACSTMQACTSNKAKLDSLCNQFGGLRTSEDFRPPEVLIELSGKVGSATEFTKFWDSENGIELGELGDLPINGCRTSFACRKLLAHNQGHVFVEEIDDSQRLTIVGRRGTEICAGRQLSNGEMMFSEPAFFVERCQISLSELDLSRVAVQAGPYRLSGSDVGLSGEVAIATLNLIRLSDNTRSLTYFSAGPYATGWLDLQVNRFLGVPRTDFISVCGGVNSYIGDPADPTLLPKRVLHGYDPELVEKHLENSDV